ncbi:hypothetical protein [Burkholderia pyrrocinia]|uniref:hypothetical protein n=1 Tax=Burkholderia pyrrocinia TaxID=60550 RepID=UPI0011E4D760|nr:hypothetical protein [Burkholderia pyrrocinia]
MEKIHQEDFEALPYEQRRDGVRALIERGLSHIENLGREPDVGRCDEMRWAIADFETRDFFSAIYHIDRVMSSATAVESSNLLTGDPDRSLSLQDAWALAQSNLAGLEAREAEGNSGAKGDAA